MLDEPRTDLELRLQIIYQMKGDAHSRAQVGKVLLPLVSCARACRRRTLM